MAELKEETVFCLVLTQTEREVLCEILNDSRTNCDDCFEELPSISQGIIIDITNAVD